jgi:hypothetical protein
MVFHICRIAFGASEIKIKSLNEIQDNKARDIAFYINSVYNDLNSTFKGSSVNKFNSAHDGIPVFVSREFLNFLRQNIDYILDTGYLLEQFHSNESFDLQSDLIFDYKTLTITKLKSIHFESRINRKNYCLDILSEYLHNEINIKEFLISSESTFIARGNTNWEIDLARLINKNIIIQLKDSAAVIEPLKNNMIIGKFMVGEIHGEYIVLESHFSALTKSILYTAIKNSRYDILEILAKKYKFNIGIIDKSDDIKVFKF